MGKDLTQSTQREEHRERREEEPEQSRGLCRVVEIREGSFHCATTFALRERRHSGRDDNSEKR